MLEKTKEISKQFNSFFLSNISRIYSFILHDYVFDEFRFTNHYTMTDIMLKLHQYAATETRVLPISLVFKHFVLGI